MIHRSERRSARAASSRSFALEIALVAGLATAASARDAAAQDSITRDGPGPGGHFIDHYSDIHGGVTWDVWTGPALSADGRWLAFDSETDLDGSGLGQGVFVVDRLNGGVVRVSLDTTSNAIFRFEPAISSDGRFVAYAVVVSVDTSSSSSTSRSILLHDRDPDGNGLFDETGTTTVQIAADGDLPSISADGRFIAYALLQGDVMVYDRTTNVSTDASVSSNGVPGNAPSFAPAISADGRVVAFVSWASNLVANDTNKTADVFLHDLASGATTRVSVDSSGAQANGESIGWWVGVNGNWIGRPALSSDGAIVAFASKATNLVTNDTNHVADVFVRDVAMGTTERVSVDSTGAEGDRLSWAPALSADGRFVAFSSSATNFARVDQGDPDVFVRDRTSGTTTVASGRAGIAGDAFSHAPALSDDGMLVAFESRAGNLVAGDDGASVDAFVHDLSVPDPAASWSNYGTGFPGTLGVPGLIATTAPALGSTLDVDIDNSLGTWTIGFLLAGPSRASIPTRSGGTILVDFSTIAPLVVPPAGSTISADIPIDVIWLIGTTFDVQVVEIDAGAAHGLSFTPGLELLFGT